LEIEDGSWEGEALPAAPPPEPQASEPDEIRSHIRRLVHKKKRSFGTTELYQQNKDKISRREFQKMVKEERKQLNTDLMEKMKRIHWRIPSSCWAFDDTFYTKDSNGKKIWIHNIKDLASQYLLPPLAGEFTKGEEVARNLQILFITHGAPHYLKADNGPNLNSKEVKEVLKRFHVVLVNSPEYYSKYNGSIENANGLIKKKVDDLAREMKLEVDIKSILPLARLAAHELNTKYRRSIKDRPVCLFWNYQDQNQNNIPKRKEVYRETMKLAQQILEEIPEEKRENKSIINRCRRKAAEEILQKRGYIEVYKN